MNVTQEVVLGILVMLVVVLGSIAIGAWHDLRVCDDKLYDTKAELDTYQLSYAAMDIALGERDRILDEVIGDLNRCKQELWEKEHE